MARTPLPYRSILSLKGKTLEEPPRSIPVWAEVDLCVVGGGAAGVGAAIGCIITLPIGCAPGAAVGAAVGGGTGVVAGAATAR